MSWRGYDEVAEAYERIHAPRFSVIAEELAGFADVAAGMRVLDLGTGTGVAAEVARARGAAPVVGVDLAQEMLRVAHAQRPGLLLAGAEAVDLPFRDGAFDVVLANFVLPNLKNHKTALAEVLRMLRPGGRFAMSAWADDRDDLERTWDELAGSLIPPRMLQQMRDAESPDFRNFGTRDFTEKVLGRAGFKQVRTDKRTYRFRYGLDEYLEGREVFKSGRFVRDMLGESGWESFRQRTRAVFAERFADPLQDTVAVVLTTAAKPEA